MTDALVVRLQQLIEQWRAGATTLREKARDTVVESLLAQRADAFRECADELSAVVREAVQEKSALCLVCGHQHYFEDDADNVALGSCRTCPCQTPNYNPNYRPVVREAVSAPAPRMFPIQGGPAIPWDVIAPFDAQCRKNHGGQDLERIAQRGGLGITEAIAVLKCHDYDKEWSQRYDPTKKAEYIIELVGLVKERQAQLVSAPTPRRAITVKYMDAYLEGIQDAIDDGISLKQVRDSIDDARKHLARLQAAPTGLATD